VDETGIMNVRAYNFGLVSFSE